VESKGKESKTRLQRNTSSWWGGCGRGVEGKRREWGWRVEVEVEVGNGNRNKNGNGKRKGRTAPLSLLLFPNEAADRWNYDEWWWMV